MASVRLPTTDNVLSLSGNRHDAMRPDAELQHRIMLICSFFRGFGCVQQMPKVHTNLSYIMQQLEILPIVYIHI
jgi:hypothetical protein